MPTATPIPTASTGGVIPAATQNDMAVLNTQIGLYGRGTSVTGGTPPTANAPSFIMQSGSTVVTLLGGSNFAIGFPSAFPNGLLCLLAGPGDNTSSLGQVQIASSSTSSFAGYGYTPAGVGVGALPVRINWFAIGW